MSLIFLVDQQKVDVLQVSASLRFKYQSTRTAWKIADDTVQILGGRGVTQTGMGAKITGLKNFAKYAAVYGGSEEIMADLAIKQALRMFPSTARL